MAQRRTKTEETMPAAFRGETTMKESTTEYIQDDLSLLVREHRLQLSWDDFGSIGCGHYIIPHDLTSNFFILEPVL
jgi:hypothetical protein